MSAVKILLDKARKVAGGISDAELARRLNVTPQTLSQWRNGDVPLPDTRIPQLAQIAEDPPEYWLVYMQGEKAKTSKLKEHWLNVFNALLTVSKPGKTLPALVLGVLAMGAMQSSHQDKSLEINDLHGSGADKMYLMSKSLK
ncbi:helix-turn-helix domain-containing protein [Xanthomonas sacchari]